MYIPHPIPYQGSKRALAGRIIKYLPHDTDKLIEPFAGSAAVSLATANSGRARSYILNDLNKPLIDLWNEIINRPYIISNNYELLWNSQMGREREYYDIVRDQFNQTHRPDYLLYLLARCVKASVRYNSNGEFNQSPDNRRKGSIPKTMKLNIIGASNLLINNTMLFSQDYRQVVELAGLQDVVYMDPPYQGVCSNRDQRYIGSIIFEDFVKTLETLNNRGISYIVSYDGQTGEKKFGKSLPSYLELAHIKLNAGRSTQATLLGRQADTIEALYLSRALINRTNGVSIGDYRFVQSPILFQEIS